MPRVSRRDVLKAGAALSLSPALWVSMGSQSKAAPDSPHPCYKDAILVNGEPPLPQPGAFTVAVLPDTQHYSEDFPFTFFTQTQWIAENQKARNIVCAIHLGDITNRSTRFEWKNAARAFSVLDGKVPYFLTTGNHDYSDGGHCNDRTTWFNWYFPAFRYRRLPTFGGVYDREPKRYENSFHLFDAGDRSFLVLALEFGPRKDVVRWANEIVHCHPDRQVILVTHAYAYHDNSRYDWKGKGQKQLWNPHTYGVAAATNHDVSDGEELWTNLISQHENFVLTLNGHVLDDGLGHLQSQTPGGRNVQQMLVNFQMKPRGGDGWLRLLEFQPDGKTVQVYDYSPTRKQRNESPGNQYTFELSQMATA
jgi:hypothetical protein